MKHSYSSLRTLAQCERQFTYKYVLGLRSAAPDRAPATVGNWMHAMCALDSLDRGAGTLIHRPTELEIGEHGRIVLDHEKGTARLTPPDGADWAPTEWLLASGASQLAAAAVEWWQWLPSSNSRLTDDLSAILGPDVPAALDRLWARYAARWADRRGHEEPLLVEYPWERDVTARDGTVPATMTGRVDAVVYDKDRGIVIVRDHKFSADWSLSTDDRLTELTGGQLHIGAWGVAPKLEAEKRPVPSAVEYDRALFSPPKTPELTKGTRAADGTWKTPPRLSKSITRYDRSAYEAFCADPAVAEIYKAEPEVLERLDTEEMAGAWFRRKLRPVSLPVIKAHLRPAIAAERRAGSLAADPESATPVPGEHCRWCFAAALCVDQMYGRAPDAPILADYGLRQGRRRVAS